MKYKGFQYLFPKSSANYYNYICYKRNVCYYWLLNSSAFMEMKRIIHNFVNPHMELGGINTCGGCRGKDISL